MWENSVESESWWKLSWRNLLLKEAVNQCHWGGSISHKLSRAGDASVPVSYWLYGNVRSLITTGNEESGEPPPAQLHLRHTHVRSCWDRRESSVWQIGENKSRLEYQQLFNHSGGKCEVDAVEHTTNTDHPLTSTYNGEDEPLSGQQVSPHGAAARWEGRTVRCPSFREAKTRERMRKLQLWPHKSLAQSPRIWEGKSFWTLCLSYPMALPPRQHHGE